MSTFHADRLTGIGSSDAAVILGISKFKSPLELWLEKTQQREPVDINDVPSVHWGTILEDVVAREFATAHPELTVRRRRILRSKTHRFALAHVDRMAKTPDGRHVPVEIKTSRNWEDWKEGVPYYYVPQVQHQLFVAEAPYAHVAVLLGGHDYREYVVERDEEYIAMLVAAETAFWANVISRTAPAPQTYRDVCSLFPKAASKLTFAATEDVLKAAIELALVRSNKATIKAREKDLMFVVGSALGEAELLVDEHGTPLITYKNVTKGGFDLDAFAADHPDLAAQYVRPIEYREMRITKGLKAAA